jgi:hypothetical protein
MAAYSSVVYKPDQVSFLFEVGWLVGWAVVFAVFGYLYWLFRWGLKQDQVSLLLEVGQSLVSSWLDRMLAGLLVRSGSWL